MRLKEVIRVADVPTVVHLGAVERLKEQMEREEEDLSAEAQDGLRFYVERYFLTQIQNRQAFETLLSSLSRHDGGGQGFWVQGVYGSGKSHLLAVLDLLMGFPAARRCFAESHPDLAERVRGLEAGWGLWAVPVALEEHRAEEALEDIVARRFGETLKRKDGEAVLPSERRERLAAMQEAAASQGCRGLVILLDELSPFLAGKSKAGLYNDASYLQFLGQRTRLFPLWVVVTLSRPFQEFELDGDLMAKMRDRFSGGIALTIEHLREILSKKLLERDE